MRIPVQVTSFRGRYPTKYQTYRNFRHDEEMSLRCKRIAGVACFIDELLDPPLLRLQ